MRSFSKKIIVPLLLTFSFASVSKAEPLRDFLVASAYGTAAGALIGVASLAFTEDPGSKLNNVARGASLGLYAGMGLGLYMGYGGGANQALRSESSSPTRFWVQAQWKQAQQKNEIDGLSFQSVFARF